LLTVAVRLLQTHLAQFTQELFGSLALRRNENGEVARLEIEVDVAGIGDFLTTPHRVLVVGEEFVHLFGRRT